MTPSRFIIAAALLVSLAGCATAAPVPPLAYLAGKGVSAPTPAAIPHCRGYGCKIVDHVTLTPDDWKEIGALFSKAGTPEQERAALKPAIGLFERKLGHLTDTEGDIRGTYLRIGDHQLDCVDESVNTTTNLILLRQKGLLRFHDIKSPQVRLPIVGGGLGPHQTAVITDRASKIDYALDSWFHDNGADAEIVPLDAWIHGWHPGDEP